MSENPILSILLQDNHVSMHADGLHFHHLAMLLQSHYFVGPMKSQNLNNFANATLSF